MLLDQKVVAYITDALAIRQIVEQLDLSPPKKPPREIPDLVRVPLDDRSFFPWPQKVRGGVRPTSIERRDA